MASLAPRRRWLLVAGFAVVLLQLLPTSFVGGLSTFPQSGRLPSLARGQGPVDAAASAFAGQVAGKISEELLKQLGRFQEYFLQGAQEDPKRKFQLHFHPDPNQGGQVKTSYWRPMQTPLAKKFANLGWCITDFEMSWINDEGQTVLLSDEEDVHALLAESSTFF